MTIKFTDQNFDQEVINSTLPVLVEFWAPWCVPCQKISPIIDNLATEMDGKIKIGTLNVDENDNIPNKYRIKFIPTFKIFSHRQSILELTGQQNIEALRNKLKNII